VKKENDKAFVPKKPEKTAAVLTHFNEKQQLQTTDTFRFCSRLGCCLLVRPGFGSTCPPGECHYRKFGFYSDVYEYVTDKKGKRVAGKSFHKVNRFVQGLWVPSKSKITRQDAANLVMKKQTEVSRIADLEEKRAELLKDIDCKLVEKFNKCITNEGNFAQFRMRHHGEADASMPWLQKLEGKTS